MGYNLEFNCLLRIPSEDGLDLDNLEVGKRYSITKDDERLYPLRIAIEICDGDYNYIGKIAIHKLSLGAGRTTIEFEVLKIFDQRERQIYNNNFIKPLAI